MLDALAVREETARLREALEEEAQQEDIPLDEQDRMVRYRKEGQISVYNYGPSIRYTDIHLLPLQCSTQNNHFD